MQRKETETELDYAGVARQIQILVDNTYTCMKCTHARTHTHTHIHTHTHLCSGTGEAPERSQDREPSLQPSQAGGWFCSGWFYLAKGVWVWVWVWVWVCVCVCVWVCVCMCERDVRSRTCM